MEPIYVTGHRNPDTDSIVAAIAYASLRNALGDRSFVAARIGGVSDETEMVLDKFGFAPPMLLKNVRTQVSDLDYDTPPILSSAVTVYHAWEALSGADASASALPVTDEDGRLFGMLTSGDIAAYDMRFVDSDAVSGVPLFNLLSCLDGQLLTRETEPAELTGKLVLALPNHEGMPAFPAGCVVICGNQPEVVRRAVESHAACIVVCESEVDRALVESSGETCIVTTPYDPYKATRLLFLAIPVSRICRKTDLVSFHLTDYLDDVKETTLKSRYRSYPILDANDKVVGTLSRFHLLRPNKKRVVLVDHNELSQSVPGLEQAEILEIIDHHRLADVETAAPVYVRNEPVGSTNTILTGMFFEKGIMPSKKLAGVSLEELGREIFAVSVTGDHDPKEMLLSDFKQFQIAGHSLGIGQITCLDSDRLSERKAALVSAMEQELGEGKYDTLLLMITDVLREGTELLAVGDTETVEHAFNVTMRDNAVFLPGVISRKKQVVPALSLLWG